MPVVRSRKTAGLRLPARPRSQIVLTFPFENTGEDASLEWLSEGLAELTIERLNGRGYYLLSRQERLDALETAGLPVSTRFTRATMIKLGEDVDADQIIFGPIPPMATR